MVEMTANGVTAALRHAAGASRLLIESRHRQTQQVPPLRCAPVGMTILLHGNSPKSGQMNGC